MEITIKKPCDMLEHVTRPSLPDVVHLKCKDTLIISLLDDKSNLFFTFCVELFRGDINYEIE